MTNTRPVSTLRVWRLVLSCGLLISIAVSLARGQAIAPASAFAKDNLHAWAFEEYDAVARTPAERARVLKTLGITKAGYVGRHVERMKEFDAYVTAYRDEGIELVAVWSPINTGAPLAEPHIRMFLDSVDRHQIKAQWWITLERFGGPADSGTVDAAVALLRPVVAEASRRGLRVALYGHGRDAWFTQPENEIAILERLNALVDVPVGIAYNFHHAHSQLDRFSEIVPKMMPYLIALNLNGMRSAGPQILPIGSGDREAEMIGAVLRAGYRGPVGILHHQRTMDAAEGLRGNVEGLRQVLTTIGDVAGASTY